MAFASVPNEDFVIEQGAERVKTVASSHFGHRGFCGECGTPLYMKVNHQPETVDFSLATLDDPAAVQSEFHIFYDSHINWAPAGDDLPRHARFRPDTRGLETFE